MSAGTDYVQQTVGVNAIDDETITELTRIVGYDQPIYDDPLVEGDEWLGQTLGVDRSSVLTNVRPMYDQAASLQSSFERVGFIFLLLLYHDGYRYYVGMVQMPTLHNIIHFKSLYNADLSSLLPYLYL